jgi:hypothetical protein
MHVNCLWWSKNEGHCVFIYDSGSEPFDFYGPPLNHYWKLRTPKPFLQFEPQNSTQTIHNKYTNYEIFYLIHKWKKYTKNRNFNFNGKVDAASQQLAFFNIWFHFWNCCTAPTNQAKGTNLIFNLKFQIPSLLQSILKFSISDFAFLHIYTLLICWEKWFNFLNSCGPPGVLGPQVKNRWYMTSEEQELCTSVNRNILGHYGIILEYYACASGRNNQCQRTACYMFVFIFFVI